MKNLPESEKPFTSLADFANMDVEATARAIEADEGESIPGLREALEEVKQGKIARVTTPEQLLLRQARKMSGLSQTEFAKRIGTPVATMRGWEQGRFSPPGTATALARLITKHPELAEELA
ncbi:MAG: helix-turn-helix domain-containing protein [Zoogloeaceae bacterium]|jgi:putative transcriptional regulator|nr:helix-turn-helix domain-containing protein [Zoogloeaceae bacterium]